MSGGEARYPWAGTRLVEEAMALLERAYQLDEAKAEPQALRAPLEGICGELHALRSLRRPTPPPLLKADRLRVRLQWTVWTEAEGVRHVETLGEAVALLPRVRFDVVLVDACACCRVIKADGRYDARGG